MGGEGVTQTTDDQIVWLNRRNAGAHTLSLESLQSREQAVDPRRREGRNTAVYKKQGSRENTWRSCQTKQEMQKEKPFPDLSHYFPNWQTEDGE